VRIPCAHVSQESPRQQRSVSLSAGSGRFGWLETAEVLTWIAAHKPPMLHLTITGRNAPKALIERADLIAAMREVKHPLHTQGFRTQKGIQL
jgi:cob(I)alamin adenosyltransferase